MTRTAPEKDYSKREMDTYMDEITKALKRIEDQTTKTNGRVNKLENWKAYITGGLAVIVILLVPILFLLLKIGLTK